MTVTERIEKMRAEGRKQREKSSSTTTSSAPSASDSVENRLARMRQEGLKQREQNGGSTVPSTAPTVQKPSYSDLEAQRKQAAMDLDTDTVNRLDREMKAIRESTGKQTFADRAGSVLSSVMSGSVGQMANTAGLAVNSIQDADHNRRQIARIQKELAAGVLSDGRTITPAMRKTMAESIDRLNREAQKWDAPSSTANRIYRAADQMVDDSTQYQQQAKQGLGKVGSTVVDAATAAGQSALSGALGAATGTGMAPFIAQAFGGSTQEARRSGASLDEQVAYGLASATKEYVTEKMFGLTLPQKILGKAGAGGIDSMVERGIRSVTERLAKSPGGQRALGGLATWLASGATEGLEEIVGDAIENVLINPNLRKWETDNRTTQEKINDALYDGLVGAVSGMMGGVNNLFTYTPSAQGTVRTAAQQGAGVQEATQEGTRTAPVQNAVETAQNAVQGQTAQQTAQRTAVESASPDVLSQLLLNRQRRSMDTLSAEQQTAVEQANERGTVGMDADGKVFEVRPEQHIDQRSGSEISNRPELHRYYQNAAESLLTELNGVVRGGETQSATGEYGQSYSWRSKREASPRISQLLDGGMSYAEIEKALDAIIHDKGQENYANAKRVELVLDQMLSDGYSDGTRFVPANDGYLAAKDAIAGSRAQERGHGLDGIDSDGLGNANAGTVNTPFDNMQAQSDTFHPVNPNSAQRIMDEQGRAPSEVPTVNPQTGMNVTKAVSTILNSPLTSKEMATVYENAVAQGEFDHSAITDQSAVGLSQAKIERDGLQEVATDFIAKVDLGQRITKWDMADAFTAYNQAVASGESKIAYDLTVAISQAAHNSAQVTQAMNLMNRLTPEGRLLTLRRIVDRMNDRQAQRQSRRQSTSAQTAEETQLNFVERETGFRVSEELATNYLMAQTDAERKAAWDALTTSIAEQMPSTFREKADFWRYTMMLMNPTTHGRNFLGNVLQFGARHIKNGVGAVIERAVIKDQSQRTKAFLGSEDKGLVEFARGQYEGDETAAMGGGKYSDSTTAGIEREIRKKRKVFEAPMQGKAAAAVGKAMPDFVHKAADTIGHGVQIAGDKNTELLDKADRLFNKSAYVDSFAQALKAKGVTAAEAAAGTRSADVEAARAYAIEEAQRATYRNTTALSEYLSKAGRMENSNKVAKAISFASDALYPFRKTPANVLTTGLDYSPVGLFKALKEGLWDLKRGNCTAADVVDSLSSTLTGSGIFALGFYLVAEGLLHVRAGKDDDEEAFEKASGGQDYALQIGDKSYTLDWALPAAMPLFAGAAVMESIQKGGGTFDAVTNAMLGMQDVVLETSMLSSLNDLVSYWSYADSKTLYLIDKAVSSYAGQYIPTVGSKIASTFDDTARKSFVSGDKGQLSSDVSYFLQSAAKKVPGARNKLQPMIDLWGNEVSNGSALGRTVQSFISPGYLKTRDTSPAAEEVRRLAEATGETSVYPQAVDKSFAVNGETKYLTAEEYTKYAKTTGTTRREIVEKLLKSKGYKKLTDSEKADAISYAYEYANVKGKQSVSSYKPESGMVKSMLKSALPPEAYILYTINSDRDKNGSTDSVESARTLQELSVSDAVRGKAWVQKNPNSNEEKNPFVGTLPDAGISADDSISIMDKYRELYNRKDMKSKEKAAEFGRYVRSLGLNGQQMAAVRKVYTMWGSFPIEW